MMMTVGAGEIFDAVDFDDDDERGESTFEEGGGLLLMKSGSVC